MQVFVDYYSTTSYTSICQFINAGRNSKAKQFLEQVFLSIIIFAHSILLKKNTISQSSIKGFNGSSWLYIRFTIKSCEIVRAIPGISVCVT